MSAQRKFRFKVEAHAQMRCLASLVCETENMADALACLADAMALGNTPIPYMSGRAEVFITIILLDE